MKRTLSSVMLLALAACGGGSSGGTPAPTPAATPAPTPTPSAPSISYVSSFDFTQSQFQESPVAELQEVESYVSDTPPYYARVSVTGSLVEAPSAAVMTWDPDQRSATVRFNDILTTYPASSITVEVDGAKRFHMVSQDGDLEEGLLWNGGGGGCEYVGGVTQTIRLADMPTGQPRRITTTTRYLLVGPVTPNVDLPASGTFAFAGAATGSVIASTDEAIAVNATVTVDLAAGTVTGTWTSGTRQYELTGTYQRDRNNRIEGTARTSDGVLSGRFVGNLYGPQAREINLLFQMLGTNVAVAGLFSGRRP